MDLKSVTGARSESILSYGQINNVQTVRWVRINPLYRIRNGEARLAAE